jgi:hypothetical protein
MKIRLLEEPLLEFGGHNRSICPKDGIANYSTFDANELVRPKEIVLGVIGTDKTIREFRNWIEQCQQPIPAKESKQPNLFTAFMGFNSENGFHSNFIIDETHCRPLSNKYISILCKNSDKAAIVEQAVEMFLEQIRYLKENKSPKVIICALPQDLIDAMSNVKGEHRFYTSSNEVETNFRRLLKAKAMMLPCQIPIQIILENTFEDNKAKQDDATKAWNFCTAVYYKARGIPWRLPKKDAEEDTCYVGISFYLSRNRETVQTSVAQIFNERGNNIILRGAIAVESKEDRKPHLTTDDASKLLKKALDEYKISHGNLPARVVLHKSSNYNQDELIGFKEGIESLGIQRSDFLTLRKSDIRLFRHGNYPPLRGSLLEVEADKKYVLYTKGSIPYYETFPSSYIPNPLEINCIECEADSVRLCEEVLALTKMNWNNTQFDGGQPITLASARNVGEILKYIEEDKRYESHYSFYM